MTIQKNKEKKKVALIGTAGIPARYGGFETLAEQIVHRLKDDFEFTIFCSNKLYSADEKEVARKKNGQSFVYVPLSANGMQSFLYDVFAIIYTAFKKIDVLLILGVSGTLILPFVKPFFRRRRIIVHIDGVEWKRDKWSLLIKKYLKFSERIGIKFADIVIADNIEIKKYIEGEYNKDSVLIEYGADHVIKDSREQNQQWKDNWREGYVFSVCRIEPENNIDMILAAFVEEPQLRLKIVGNWEVSQYSKQLYEKYSECENIDLLLPIYDIAKLNKLRSNCRLYIHGHSAGGTNPSLVEAMYMGLPILAFNVVYNVATTNGKALYFGSKSDLLDVLKFLDNETLSANGYNMRTFARRNYTWKIIAEKYAAIF